ncbi:hypothetical protein GCM10023144_21700 [Pigmentiphaga soli]|uniref:Uncharacterized protein n=1 Tax=Pigmentiphaga soli TaxID=1007095 RepID=A0ABP8GZA9_9BURK
MSDGAGEQYKGYYIKTVAHPVNPHGASVLYEASASISRNAAANYNQIAADHLGEGQVFDSEFEAHRYAERMARKYIDALEKAAG